MRWGLLTLSMMTFPSVPALVPCPDSLGEEHLLAAGQIDNHLRLRLVRHESLLHEARLPFPEGFLRDVEMVRMRRGHIEEVHFRIINYFRVRPIGMLDAPLTGKSLRFLQRP